MQSGRDHRQLHLAFFHGRLTQCVFHLLHCGWFEHTLSADTANHRRHVLEENVLLAAPTIDLHSGTDQRFPAMFAIPTGFDAT